VEPASIIVLSGIVASLTNWTRLHGMGIGVVLGGTVVGDGTAVVGIMINVLVGDEYGDNVGALNGAD